MIKSCVFEWKFHVNLMRGTAEYNYILARSRLPRVPATPHSGAGNTRLATSIVRAAVARSFGEPAQRLSMLRCSPLTIGFR